MNRSLSVALKNADLVIKRAPPRYGARGTTSSDEKSTIKTSLTEDGWSELKHGKYSPGVLNRELATGDVAAVAETDKESDQYGQIQRQPSPGLHAPGHH